MLKIYLYIIRNFLNLIPRVSLCLAVCIPILQAENFNLSLHQKWKFLRAESYAAPTTSQLRSIKELFSSLFEQGIKVVLSPELKASFNTLGMHVYEFNYKKEKLILIHERRAPYQGTGLFIIRPGGNGVMLQAPHGFSDLYTGKLAIQLMQEANYSVLALNTIARKYRFNGETLHADMAHLGDSYFLSLSHAYADSYPNGTVVQLHGFNAAKRSETENVNMIISTGVKTYNPQLQAQSDCLKQTLTQGVLTYPQEINVLGGTTNSIGRLLRKMGFSEFRHFEMSLDLRKRLIKNQTMRSFLSACVIGKKEKLRKKQ